VYASSRKALYNKISLESIYTDWSLLLLLSSTASHLIPSSNKNYDFFAVTDDNVVGLVFDNASSCQYVKSSRNILTSSVSWGDVTATASSSTHIYLYTSSMGLSEIAIDTGVVTHIDTGDASEEYASMLWVQAWGRLFLGSSTRFLGMHYVDGKLVKFMHEWIGGLLDSTPIDMSYDVVHNALWVAENNSVHKLSSDGGWWRYGQRQGSPSAGITSVASAGGFVWIGTNIGLARVPGDADATQQYKGSLDKSDSDSDPWTWAFFGGHRYLPDNTVMQVIAGGKYADTSESIVLVRCETGLATLESTLWTLSEKSKSMAQFQYPRHDRRGLTADCGLHSYGDVSSYYKKVKDNDGLWTSMHGMGEAYRFMSTGEEEARDAAWRAFEAVELLSILPGAYPTYPARSYCVPADQDEGCGTASGEDRWHYSTVDGWEEYLWKDDTSSDEIDGHLAFYPLVYDYIARNDEEKKRAYNLIEGITGGIVENDLYLIDPLSQKPTTWGFWNPELVNDDPEHYSERGSNSVEILGFLASAYSITSDEKYKKTFWDLAENYGYLYNAYNAKIDNPEEDNHSDNELIFLGYHTLLYSLQRLNTPSADRSLRQDVQEMVDAVLPSLRRSWSIVQGEKSPLWLGIYAGTGGQVVSRSAVSDATWTLRRWAIDLIEWDIDNSNRWDVTESPFYARDSTNPLMRQIVPPMERQASHWNSDPFVMAGGSGMGEMEPSIWRLPYYLMRYNGLIVESHAER